MSLKTNILLSGATGILGSHVLFELLELYVSGKISGRIGLIIRPTEGFCGKKINRLEDFLKKQNLPFFLQKYDTEVLLKPIFVIYKNIHEVGANDFPCDFNDLIFIHAAGSVNLAGSEKVFDEIAKTNYEGTLSVLKRSISRLRKFVFISTAYATGHRRGFITDDFLNYEPCNFRNPYELFKNRTEKELVNFCEQSNVDWQILRPSIICGRLIDHPVYFIPRFSVFYLICKYFSLLKKCTFSDPYMRIHVVPGSGLNILPVDYLAKAICRLMDSDIKQANLVHSTAVEIQALFEIALNEYAYRNYSIVSEPIVNPSIYERRYEMTINSQLHPYIETPDHTFDTRIIRQVMADIPEPDVLLHFPGLIRFAAQHRCKSIY